MIRVTFVITGLGIGGAEHALLRLLSRFDRRHVVPALIVLGSEDALAGEFRAIGVPPLMLGLRAGSWPLGQIGRFVQAVRDTSPDVVQGWMYHGNLAASYAAARIGVSACWSVRDTPDAAHAHSLFTRAVIRLSAPYARHAAHIFNVSAASAEYCAAHLGWPRERTEVLPNGIDTAKFIPDPARRAVARAAWGVADAQPVIGMVARWASVKNHALFLAAATRLRERCPDVAFVLVGKGMDEANAELALLIRTHCLQDHVRLLGARRDVEALYPGFDLATLTSRSEGFPNVLAEAMSCGVPVVSTDVGDARDIVAGAGRIVAADENAFADAWLDVLRNGAALGAAGRERIRALYDLDAIAERLQARYMQIAGQ